MRKEQHNVSVHEIVPVTVIEKVRVLQRERSIGATHLTDSVSFGCPIGFTCSGREREWEMVLTILQCLNEN